MPFGIPCDEPPVAELLRHFDIRNTQIGNLVYNVVFPIGQAMTVREKMLQSTHKTLGQKIRVPLNRFTKGIGTIIEGIAGSINDQISRNGIKLAQAQSAIALAPTAYSPDIPAADIRQIPVPAPAQEAIALVQNTIRERDESVGCLTSLLLLLGVTPQQIRRYCQIGTIPDVWLCPNPGAHDANAALDVEPVPDPGFWESAD